MANNLVIAISREFGSGGRAIGKKLAEELGIAFYDKELIELAAEKSGLAPDFIRKSEESASSSLLFGLAGGGQSFGGYFLHGDISVGDKAFFAQSAVIRELAEKESCVILGRLGGYILRENPACVKVFLHSSLDNRLTRAMQEYGMGGKGLADKLVKIDKQRANYRKYYTGESWSDARLYDIVLNTGVCGIDGAVKAIRAIAETVQEQNA